MIPVLWLCGPPGVGKTAVAWEIYERLTRAGAAPAYVDVDQLGMCYPATPSDPERHGLKARNAASLGANFSSAGARCLIVSGVLDSQRGPSDELRASQTIVGRLRVDPGELRARVVRRMGSLAQPDAAAEEAEVLDRSTFADWCVDTTGLSIAEAASRVLAEVGDWPPTGSARRDQPLPEGGPTGADGGELLWVSGATGVGKSTVAFPIYLGLLRTGAMAAYVDVDQLGFCSTARHDHGLRARNLAALWGTFQDAGARLAVVVGPVATAAEACRYEQALTTTTFTWCRLHVSDEELTRRILSRQDGGGWAQPGDPLRDLATEELLRVADRAIVDAHTLERHGVGLRIEVDGLAADDAAAAVLDATQWPARAS